MRLFDPWTGEDLIIGVLKHRHQEHLAALERDLELTARTIQPLATIDHLSGQGVVLAEDTAPAVLVGLTSTNNASRSQTRSSGGDKIPAVDIGWALNMQLIVVGKDRSDTIKRRGFYAMTIIECVLQRLPRDQDVFDTIEFTGMDFTDGETVKSARVVGEAQIAFTVLTRAAVQLRGLPPDNTTLTPGLPGGAPAAPYDEPVPWPEASTVGPADVDLD